MHPGTLVRDVTSRRLGILVETTQGHSGSDALVHVSLMFSDSEICVRLLEHVSSDFIAISRRPMMDFSSIGDRHTGPGQIVRFIANRGDRRPSFDMVMDPSGVWRHGVPIADINRLVDVFASAEEAVSLGIVLPDMSVAAVRLRDRIRDLMYDHLTSFDPEQESLCIPKSEAHWLHLECAAVGVSFDGFSPALDDTSIMMCDARRLDRLAARMGMADRLMHTKDAAIPAVPLEDVLPEFTSAAASSG